jgi:hypothetical protein
MKLFDKRSVQVFNGYFTSPLVGEVAAEQRVRGTEGARSQVSEARRIQEIHKVLRSLYFPGSWLQDPGSCTPHPTLRVDLSHKGER